MKNYDISCFGPRIQGGETVQLIIYMMVLFLKTENVFFKSIALSVVAQVLACSSDKRSMKKNSGKRW